MSIRDVGVATSGPRAPLDTETFGRIAFSEGPGTDSGGFAMARTLPTTSAATKSPPGAASRVGVGGGVARPQAVGPRQEEFAECAGN